MAILMRGESLFFSREILEESIEKEKHALRFTNLIGLSLVIIIVLYMFVKFIVDIIHIHWSYAHAVGGVGFWFITAALFLLTNNITERIKGRFSMILFTIALLISSGALSILFAIAINGIFLLFGIDLRLKFL